MYVNLHTNLYLYQMHVKLYTDLHLYEMYVSIRIGICPDSSNIVTVKPVYKKGEQIHVNNYRPTVFERLIFGQINNYFNIYNLLCDQQYGFRSGHSTESATGTIKLIDTIIQNMDNTRITKTPVTLFLDLSKAFDTLNFDSLLHKLQYYVYHYYCSKVI